MRRKLIFILAALGLLVGLVSAYVSAQQPTAQQPVFSPASNPYENGIYANGIVESRQSHGANISIFPDVTGPVTKIAVKEGDNVKAGAVLVQIDDSVQRQTTAQQQAQIAVTSAQIASAKATLKLATDTLAKLESTYRTLPGAVSEDQLDTQRNTVKVAQANLLVSQQQYTAQISAAAAATALLQKYTLRAPREGVVLAINAATGGYVSPQGTYDTYTQGYLPVAVIGSNSNDLEVRSYIDEILIAKLPPLSKIRARMYIQGTNISVPLVYERIQPYVSPKIELSDQRLEQVDVRVLPIIFRIAAPVPVRIYPGQLVDVYLGSTPRSPSKRSEEVPHPPASAPPHKG